MRLQLKACNWSVASREALTLARDFDERKLVPLAKSYYRLVIRGLSVNFHRDAKGQLEILNLALERILALYCSDITAPTSAEVRQVLRYVPELRKNFRFKASGEKWTLAFRGKGSRLRAKDWNEFSGALIFQTGEEFRFFDFKRTELQPLLKLLSFMNGQHGQKEIIKSFKGPPGLASRFILFCRKHKLLLETTSKAARQSKAAPSASFRFVSHACLQIASRTDSVFIDPVLFQPKEVGIPTAWFAHMDEVVRDFAKASALVISHAHWDHLHISAVARFPRSVPVYVPSHGTSSQFNSSTADFFRSLGFENVFEIDWWQSFQVGGIEVLAVPYYGEWFGPDSSFDGFTYLITVDGKKLYGLVDAYRDERGHMTPVLRRLGKVAGKIDFFFFPISGRTHENLVFCSRPHFYSSEFRKLSRLRRFIPDVPTVEKWARILRPAVGVPYAEIMFHNAAPRKAPWRPQEEFDFKGVFDRFWARSAGPLDYRTLSLKRDLEALQGRLKASQTRILMLGPGERVAL